MDVEMMHDAGRTIEREQRKNECIQNGSNPQALSISQSILNIAVLD